MHKIVLAFLLLVAGCSGADESASTASGAPTTSTSASPSATATTAATPTTASATTAPPTSASPETTSAATTSSTTPPREHEPVLVFADRTAGAPRLVFVDRTGEVVKSVPLDRRTPTVHSVVDDHQGGIVVTNSPPPVSPGSIIWYPARSTSWRVLAESGESEALNWPQPSVVNYQGADSLLFGALTDRAYHDAVEGVDVLEHRRDLRIVDLAGESVATLVSAESEFFVGRPAEGAIPRDMGYGSDRLMILWNDAECTWLEFRDESGAIVDMAANPLPRREPCDDTVTDARLSRDGRYVVTEAHSPRLLVTVYDLANGSQEVLEGVVAGGIRFDGDRTFGGVTIGENRKVTGGLLVAIEPSGLRVTIFPLGEDVGDVHAPAGVLSRVPDLPSDATLASDAPSAPCVASDIPPINDQPELPEPVKATRSAIAEAAGVCDLFRLAELGKGMFWSKLGDCDEGPLVSIDEVDPLPLWHQNLDLMVTLVETLDADPELVDDVYRWRADGQTIGVSQDGTWVEYEVTPQRPPCETIWCTC